MNEETHTSFTDILNHETAKEPPVIDAVQSEPPVEPAADELPSQQETTECQWQIKSAPS
ncbi:MAG: hypothetical protein AAF228_13805 [Pseudomonadota bacterium]